MESGYSLHSARLASQLCDEAVAELNRLAVERPDAASWSQKSIHVHNPFLYSKSLRKIMNCTEIETIVKDKLGGMYILRNIVASNLVDNSRLESPRQFKEGIGFGWHRDTPQYYSAANESICLPAGFCYQLVIALESTSHDNATKLLEGSQNYHSKAHRWGEDELKAIKARYRETALVLSKGDIAIIDDNLIHKAGTPTNKSRWVLFMSLTPWYIRSYFKYDDLEPLTDLEYQLFGHCIDVPKPDRLIRCSFRRSS